MNFKLSAAALAIVLLCGTLHAQTLLTGIISDESGEPLTGATIQIDETSLATTTNVDGEFSFSNMSAGSYKLRFAFLGFQTVIEEVEVTGTITKFNLTMKQSTFLSEQVTVTAFRASEDEPVSKVTRQLKEIETEFQGQDVGFILEELSPSIVTYSESGTGFSNYSGFRLRGMDQTRVNMTLNGVPLNDMIDQGVFFSNFTDLGNSIQSVQIQRGVGTSSNGTSSYAGSINFESLNVYDTVPSAEVQLTGGSFGTMRASAELQTGRMKNNMAFYARYSGITSDGYRDNTSTDSRSFFFSGAYFANKHSLKFTGFIGRSQNGLAYSPVAIEDIENNPRTNYISPNDIDDFGQWMAQFQHNYQINNRLSLVSTLYYNGAGGDFPFGFSGENGTFTQINYPLFNRHIGAMSNLNWTSLNNSMKINFGVHGYTFGRENIEQIVPDFDNPYYEDESRKNELSTFVKARKQLGSLTVFADVQLRAVSLELQPDTEFLGMEASVPDRNWLFLNPKAGMTYSFNNRFSAYASMGRTGREPTRFDILGSTQINSGNLVLAQDVDAVEPEFVNDLELGAKLSGKNFAISTNFFYMQFENEIAPIGEFIPEGFVQVNENQESSYRTGVELDYHWMIVPKLKMSGHATWMQSRISEYTPQGSDETFKDITSILSPDWNVQTRLEVEVLKDCFVYVSARYLSESFMELTNDPALVIPESLIADVGVRYTLLDKHEIRFDLNNVFDDLYYTNGAPVVGLDGSASPGYFVQAPRHIFATLVLRY